MALSAYIAPFNTDSSGEVKGSCQQVGREDNIEVYGMSHEVVSPRDAATGLATGKRQHKPLSVTKRVDKASPLLMDVLTKNGQIPELAIRFYRPSAEGEETHHYTITLKKATISSIRQEQLNNKYPDAMPHEYREHVSFTYDTIIWKDEGASIEIEDSWTNVRGG